MNYSVLISFILNCLIVFMVLFSFAAMFCGWNFMGKTGELESTGLSMFRFFTIDSNVLVGVCSIFMACAELRVLVGTTAELETWVYVIKLMGSSAVMLTLMVTIFFLAPNEEKPMALFYNSNLFFHLVVPIVAGISFAFAERTDSLSFGYAIFGAIPTFLYAFFYLINVVTHLTEGKPDRKHDFYNFLDGKTARIPAVIVVILSVSYGLSVLLWWLNGLG